MMKKKNKKTISIVLAAIIIALVSVAMMPMGTAKPVAVAFEGTVSAITPQNLLTNPGAETGDMTGWTIIADGGDGWGIWGVDTTDYEGPYEGDHCFLTSYEWCKRSQEVDLLAKGYTEAQLDATPTVNVEEWFGQGNPYDRGIYYLKVELRDKDHNVIASWDSGKRYTTWRGTGPASWEGLSLNFSDYGPGLRYIYWEDGGKDENWWTGYYGAKLDAASLTVEVAPLPSLLTNPGAETGDMTGWKIIADGGDGWKVDDLSGISEYEGPYEGKYCFRTSYEWCKRSQEIDLLKKGYTAKELDASPTVKVEEWFGQPNPYDKSLYYLKVKLLDKDHKVIASWDSGELKTTKCGSWDQLYHEFSGYPSGLRYIYWEDGGNDVNWWSGHYGAILDAASLIIEAAPAQPTVSIYTDKTSYAAGEEMHLGLDVKNPLDSAQRVSLYIYSELPTGGTFTLMDTTVTLPAGLDYSNPDFKVIRLPDIPSGEYIWHAILDDPVTGGIICEDIAKWEFIGVESPTGDITEILEQTTAVIDFSE